MSTVLRIVLEGGRGVLMNHIFSFGHVAGNRFLHAFLWWGLFDYWTDVQSPFRGGFGYRYFAPRGSMCDGLFALG